VSRDFIQQFRDIVKGMGLIYELSVDARKPQFTELRLIMKAMQVVE
jgi:hypothetical protein